MIDPQPQPQPEPEPAAEYVDTAGVAELLRARPASVRDYHNRGMMPRGVLCRREFERRKLHFSRSEIERWIAAGRPRVGLPPPAKKQQSRCVCDDDFICLACVASQLEVTRGSVMKWHRSGLMPSPELYRRTFRWCRSEFENWLAETMVDYGANYDVGKRGRRLSFLRRDPTPHEIAERCAEIQRAWKPWERLRRRYGITNEREQSQLYDPEREWMPAEVSSDCGRHDVDLAE